MRRTLRKFDLATIRSRPRRAVFAVFAVLLVLSAIAAASLWVVSDDGDGRAADASVTAAVTPLTAARCATPTDCRPASSPSTKAARRTTPRSRTSRPTCSSQPDSRRPLPGRTRATVHRRHRRPATRRLDPLLSPALPRPGPDQPHHSDAARPAGRHYVHLHHYFRRTRRQPDHLRPPRSPPVANPATRHQTRTRRCRR